MENIEYSPVPGWEGFYEISKCGKVRSVGRIIPTKHGQRYLAPKILSVYVNGTGYPSVFFGKPGKTCNRTIHRLLAETFIPNPDDKPFINHKDSDRKNFSLDNLEWVTHKENILHAVKAGRIRIPTTGVGITQYSLSGEKIRDYVSISNAATITGIKKLVSYKFKTPVKLMGSLWLRSDLPIYIPTSRFKEKLVTKTFIGRVKEQTGVSAELCESAANVYADDYILKCVEWIHRFGPFETHPSPPTVPPTPAPQPERLFTLNEMRDAFESGQLYQQRMDGARGKKWPDMKTYFSETYNIDIQ